MSDEFNLFDELTDDFVGTDRRKWIRAPFAMPGGKMKSLPHIIPEIEQRLSKKGRWIDVFGGSGVVSFNAPEAKTMVFNDRHSAITDFYACVRDRKDELLAYLNLMPASSRQQFYECRDYWSSETDPLKRAAFWYYHTKLSVIEKGVSFGRGLKSNHLPIGGGLDLFHNVSGILKRFVLENLDARRLMLDYDDHSAVFYLDPPYVNTDKPYANSWVKQDLMDLLAQIGRTKGCVILSHYPDVMINSQHYWDEVFSWQVHAKSDVQSFDEANHCSDKQNVQSVDYVTECLWIKEAT